MAVRNKLKRRATVLMGRRRARVPALRLGDKSLFCQ